MSTINRRHLLGIAGAGALLPLAGCNAFKSSGTSSGDVPTITVQRVGDGTDLPAGDAIKPRIDEKVGIDLQLQPTADSGAYYQRLGTALASGTTADLFQVNRNFLQQLTAQGLTLDVTDLLDNELSTYRDWAGEEALRVATVNGKVFACAARPYAGPYTSLWIRKDWLDNLGLDVPTTTSELREVARAFTKDDPDGNGKKNTFGLVAGGLGGLDTLFPAFGSGGTDVFYSGADGVVNGLLDPRSQQAMAFLADLIKDGSVHPDTLTLDSTRAIDQAVQGSAGMLIAGFSPLGIALNNTSEAQPDAQWIQVEPVAGPDGDRAVPHDPYTTNMFAMPHNLDDVKREKVCELLNYISSPEGNGLVSFGVEGTDWTRVDGVPKLTEEALTKTNDERGFSWMYQFTGRDDEPYLKRGGTPYPAEHADMAIHQPVLETYSSLVTYPDDFNKADVDRFVQEKMIALLTGRMKFDDYDDFTDELLGKFGFQKYLDSAEKELTDLGIGR